MVRIDIINNHLIKRDLILWVIGRINCKLKMIILDKRI